MLLDPGGEVLRDQTGGHTAADGRGHVPPFLVFLKIKFIFLVHDCRRFLRAQVPAKGAALNSKEKITFAVDSLSVSGHSHRAHLVTPTSTSARLSSFVFTFGHNF
ncbi:hypothetical protein TYRP_008732 [Tyrophagus putrescentiae]|nr:hypothetical protein TYRP_008732 [Tyrophagus putrescentiae]